MPASVMVSRTCAELQIHFSWIDRNYRVYEGEVEGSVTTHQRSKYRGGEERA